MKTLVLNRRQIERKVERLAHEIYEHNFGEKEIVVAGIASRGYRVAQRIAQKLRRISPLRISLGCLTLNKRDPLAAPAAFTLPDGEIRGKAVVIVDDVVNSGRTLAFALNYFLRLPVKEIRVAVLVDRSHNLFPIRADYVGVSLSTTLQERVSVEVENEAEGVFLV